MDNPYKRVEDDSPNRCQATTAVGQCNLIKQPNSDFCIVHGGNKGRDSAYKHAANNYRLTKWQARMQEKAEGDNIKSLRDEIGILRILIEERVNFCHTETDLMLQSGQISELIMKVEKVVTSCHKLETYLGMYLDSHQVMEFATRILEILSKRLVGQEALMEVISHDIISALSTTSDGEDTSDGTPT